MADGRSPIPTCPECGKSFPSNKSLYGHLRCHPERDYRGVNRTPPAVSRLTASQTDDYVDPEVVAGMLLLASPRSDLDGPDELESEHNAASSSHQGIDKLRPEPNSAGASAAGERSYPCSLCFRVFSSHQALGGHTASHNKEKATSNGEEAATRKAASTEHKCRFCDVSFSSGQALGGHQRRHFKELSIQQAHDPAASPSTRSCEADEMGSNRASTSCSESEEGVRKKHRVVMMDLDLNLEPNSSQEEDVPAALHANLETSKCNATRTIFSANMTKHPHFGSITEC